MEYKHLFCNNIYQHKFDEKFKELFFNTYKFSNHDKNKFILFLRKGVYPYEWLEKIQRNNFTWKRRFLHSLKYRGFYWCKWCACKTEFEIKNSGECSDSNFQAILYCYQMYLRTLEICVLKYRDFILQNFFQYLN